MKVIGIEQVKGTSKKTGNPYEGYVIYLTSVSPKVEGERAERVYLSKKAYEDSNPFTTRMNLFDEVDFTYNKYKQVVGWYNVER